jgi:hypothetical protein
MSMKPIGGKSAPDFVAETAVAIIQSELVERFLVCRARADEEKRELSIYDALAQARRRARRDLRTDTGRIARRHCYPWTCHVPSLLFRELSASFEAGKVKKRHNLSSLVIGMASVRRPGRRALGCGSRKATTRSNNYLRKSRNRVKLAI